MIDDYLKRGYPGSARHVLQQMKLEGCPPTLETIQKVAVKYGELGGARQVMELISETMTGEKADFPVTGEVIAAGVTGCVKEGDANLALDMWDQYSPRILLTYTSAEILVRSFTKLRCPNAVVDVYRKLKKDWKFQPTDPASLFEAVIFASSNFEDVLEVFNDMKEYNIPITVNTYITILRHCFKYADVKNAMTIMKGYIKDYSGLPLLRKVVMLFFSIIARYDFGKYKREARAWLNRIVTKKSSGHWLPLSRSHYSSLETEENTFLTPSQTIDVTRYIQQMDYSQIVCPAENKQSMTPLFEGSDIDIEDILIHEHGYDEKAVHEAIGVDPTYNRVKEQLEKVNASFEARKQQSAIEKGDDRNKEETN